MCLFQHCRLNTSEEYNAAVKQSKFSDSSVAELLPKVKGTLEMINMWMIWTVYNYHWFFKCREPCTTSLSQKYYTHAILVARKDAGHNDHIPFNKLQFLFWKTSTCPRGRPLLKTMWRKRLISWTRIPAGGLISLVSSTQCDGSSEDVLLNELTQLYEQKQLLQQNRQRIDEQLMQVKRRQQQIESTLRELRSKSHRGSPVLVRRIHHFDFQLEFRLETDANGRSCAFRTRCVHIARSNWKGIVWNCTKSPESENESSYCFKKKRYIRFSGGPRTATRSTYISATVFNTFIHAFGSS